jgi:phage tail sheath protein FI
MTDFTTPGVYIQEFSVFPPTIAEVPSAVPVFIGYTDRDCGGTLHNAPTRIGSLVEYEDLFGAGPEEYFTVDLVQDHATRFITIASITLTERTPRYRLYDSLRLYFANGGGTCYIVSTGTYGSPLVKGDDSHGLLGGLAAAAAPDEPALLVIPDAVSLPAADCFAVQNRCLDQCATRQDRFAILDIHGEDVAAFRNGITDVGSLLKYGTAYHPWLESTLGYRYRDAGVTIGSHRLKGAGRLGGRGLLPAALSLAGRTIGDSAIKQDIPELYDRIRHELDNMHVTMPPGGAMAGVYARTDRERGVWKAPANVALNSVVRPTITITDTDQDTLNVDPAGKSINAIRTFTGKGIMIWGARTLAGNDNEWRYVPVRRYFIMVEESLKKGTAWAVFESNDATTWTRVKSQIENYLIQKWRDGALAGARPEQAFYVRCGVGTTMTALDVAEGRMIVQVGMAVVRPAEFITLRFVQTMQQTP